MEMEKSRLQNRQAILELCVMALCLSLLITASYIRIPLAFMIVTLQLTVQNLIGLILRRKQVVFVCVAYTVLGLIGIPVFASGAGPAAVLNPTFGYVLGFTVGVALAALVLPKGRVLTLRRALLFSLINIVTVYAVGGVYFAIIINVYLGQGASLWNILLWAVLTTLPKDLILAFLTAGIAVRLRRRLFVLQSF